MTWPPASTDSLAGGPAQHFRGVVAQPTGTLGRDSAGMEDAP